MNVLLVGCGKMGGAMLSRWQSSGICTKIHVVEPTIEITGVSYSKSITDLPENFYPDTVVFAVKPQTLPDIIGDYKPFAEDGALFLSIAAGKTISFFESHLGQDAKIIRAMPNTPAAIGQGITVACINSKVSPFEQENAAKILGVTGEILWVKNEDLMNPVTALSGSGPAYVFLLIEAMASAGIKCGLDKAMAEKLARQTVIGSAALAAQTPDTTADQLRKDVTSPGGTTEAALKILMADQGLQDLFDRALTQASARAKELSE